MTFSRITIKPRFFISTRTGAFRYHIIDKSNSKVRWVPGRPDLTEYRLLKMCKQDYPITPKWELHDQPPPGYTLCVACENEYAWFAKHGARRLWVSTGGSHATLQVRPAFNPQSEAPPF